MDPADSPEDGPKWSSIYELKDRVYLGPTSTDHELSFLMANQGLVKKGDLSIDPFFGTGSLMIAAAVFGAQVFGTEIDVRVIKGLGVGRKNKQSKSASKYAKVNGYTNFEEYGLPLPEILRMDCTINLFKKSLNMFDQIICDPPYGIRAGARESGAKEFEANKKEEDADLSEESHEEDANELEGKKAEIKGDPMKEGEEGEV